MDLYISDLHLGHQNALKFDNRPFESLDEMHRTIIANRNNAVCADDCVYILGDITWNNTIGAEIISQLKGRKFLIKGNHDRPNGELKSLFEWIKDTASVMDGSDQVILSHYPMICWQRSDHGSVHLYGHVHAGRDHRFVLANHRAMLEAGIKHECYNVGCMLPYMDFTPRTLAEIRAANAV